MKQTLFYYIPNHAESPDSIAYRESLTWFNSTFNKNEIDFPIYFKRKQLQNNKTKQIIVVKNQANIKLNTFDLFHFEVNEPFSIVFSANSDFWHSQKPIFGFEAEFKNCLFPITNNIFQYEKNDHFYFDFNLSKFSCKGSGKMVESEQ